MKTGFIGLGNLGMAIAENLLHSGPLYIYNRTASKAQPLVSKGAVLCGSVKELAQICDVVFSIVSDDAALKDISEGPEGLAVSLKPGGIHVSLSTILPATSEWLLTLHLQHGSQYLACPVMARPEVARARKINFLISGDPASIQVVKPLLEKAGGINTWDFGKEVGAANVAKISSNYLIIAAIGALGESINLARRSNIDADLWMNMLTQTYFNCPAYINYSKLILQEAFLPAAFSLRLGLKDMNLAIQQAQQVHTGMPLGGQIQSLLQQAISEGLGDHDVAAVALTIKEDN